MFKYFTDLNHRLDENLARFCPHLRYCTNFATFAAYFLHHFVISMWECRVKSAILCLILKLEQGIYRKIPATCDFLRQGCQKLQSQIMAANRSRKSHIYESISIEIVWMEKVAIAKHTHENLGLDFL